MKVLVAQSCPTLATPWTVASQAPLSVEFYRQAYSSGLPFPSPGIFLTQGLNWCLLHLQADSVPSERPGKPSPRIDACRFSEGDLLLVPKRTVKCETQGNLSFGSQQCRLVDNSQCCFTRPQDTPTAHTSCCMDQVMVPILSALWIFFHS